MTDTENLYLFFIASVMLNLTPGNDMLYVMSRTMSQGVKAGIYSAVGIFIGCFVHIAAAIFGLSLIIAESALLFEIIKYAGAGYLIYLGIKSLFSKSDFGNDLEKLASISAGTLLRQGIVTNALNPKVAIFFLSFLPQFIEPAGNYGLQLLGFGLWFDIQGTLILIIVAFIFGKTRNILKRNRKIIAAQEKITGVILILLGIKLALTSRK